MLTPSCQHLLDKLDGISYDVLWELGAPSDETNRNASFALHSFVSKLHFEEDREKILALIEYLSKELMHPSQPNNIKQGGLTGFVVLTIALGKEFASQLLHKILPPILDILHDFDVVVRRFACETICEIAKVVRRGIITFFDRIVFVFSLLRKDSDTVSYINDVLSRILKSAATEGGELRIGEFLDFLKERMRTIHSLARLFLLNWIKTNAPELMDPEWFCIEFIDAWFHKLRDPESDARAKACDQLAQILSLLKLGH